MPFANLMSLMGPGIDSTAVLRCIQQVAMLVQGNWVVKRYGFCSLLLSNVNLPVQKWIRAGAVKCCCCKAAESKVCALKSQNDLNKNIIKIQGLFFYGAF